VSQSVLTPLGDELLDHPDADPGLVSRSLHHLARANWWFGGWWAVRRGLARVTRRLGGSAAQLTLLDVGSGDGNLAVRAVRWGRRRGITIVPIGVERHRAAARLTGARGIASAVACAAELPTREHSVDIVIASQLIHHLSRPAILAFCQAAARAARYGVVIADLRRSIWAHAAFQVGARLIALDRVTRLDGLTSIRRGFTRPELERLLAGAGLTARVEASPGYRLVATWIPEAL
jgi:2-polyprenyl-3-methyl-5-hydroxy-6-metoxy-1,4-benzoquinol methylase